MRLKIFFIAASLITLLGSTNALAHGVGARVSAGGVFYFKPYIYSDHVSPYRRHYERRSDYDTYRYRKHRRYYRERRRYSRNYCPQYSYSSVYLDNRHCDRHGRHWHCY